MTDHPEQNHWKLLASELGTPPPPPKKPSRERSDQIDGSRQPPGTDEGAAPSAPAPRRREPSPRTPKPPRAPGGWSELATELGVVVPQRPTEGATEAAPAVPDEPPREPVVEPARIPEPYVESPVELVDPAEFEPAEFEPELVEVEPEAPETQATEQETEPARQKSSRRRRKRRRPARSGDRAETTEAETETPGADEDEPAADRAVETTEASPGEDDEPSRPKRRRRRRPGRSRRGGSEATADPDRSEDEPAVAAPETQAMATTAVGGPDAADESLPPQETRDEDSGHTRPSHRGVPTWKDSIDILISANMEARAKNPDRGSSSRGRGRARGGRDRKR